MSDEYDDEAPSALTTAPPRANQIARQDFAGSSLAMQGGATEALVAKARAGVEARCIMAMRRPRHMADVRHSVVAECKRPRFASVAMYAKPVGSKKNEQTGKWETVLVEGLSIRFAEVALRCMGNMECSSETIYEDAAVRLVRVVAVDYETNGTWQKDLTITKTVERRQLKKGQRPLNERVNSYGDRVFLVEATDDEVAIKEAAAVSKASRTAILRLIPGGIQDEARELIKATIKDANAKDPSAARNRMLDAFATLNVKPSALEQWLGHDLDSASPAEIEQLRLVHTAIKEGETSWADALAEAMGNREEAPAPAAKPTSAPAAPQAPKPDPAPQTPPPAEPPPQAKPEPAPVERAPTRAAAPPKAPATSGGKGTAALKGALTGKPKATDIAPTIQETDPALKEPEWMVGETRGATIDGARPVEPEVDASVEERPCASCGVPIDVSVSDPPGVKCYACRQA